MLSGSEVGTDAYWIALYDDKGKLLDAQPCPSFYWKNGETMYVAPEFSSEILRGAQTAKRFVFDEKWIPQNTKPVLNSAT
ncbi:MAG: hypothetical protein MR451_05640 [Clostridiales bacterium]|nr:hypothetical protein [Clostridiales bacterium]